MAEIDNPDAKLIALGEAYARPVASLKAARDGFNEKAWLAQELAWMRLGYETPPDHPTPELRELWYDECLMTPHEGN